MPVPMPPMQAMTLQGRCLGGPNELREMVSLLKERGRSDVPLDRRPLDQADNALNDLRGGKVDGRVVLIS